MPAGTVEVFLIGAIGIKDTEIFGKGNPYAVLTCGKQKHRSNTASKQGSKPIWNQKFSFYIDDHTTDLYIRIFNHKLLTEDDELGNTIIPLAKLFADNKLPTTSYNLKRPSNRVQGEIKLSIAFSPKDKTGQENTVVLPGPYNGRIHGSPYAPTPTVRHDPLLGPNGYYKTNSRPPFEKSSHGGSNSSVSSDSGWGSGREKQESGMNFYPHGGTSIYPPISSISDSHSGSSDGHFNPTVPFDYEGDAHRQHQHGHASLSSAPSFHGIVPPAAAATVYPPLGPVQSIPPSHFTSDDLAEIFTGVNINENSGRLHGYYKSESFSIEHPRFGYPPNGSSPYGGYPSHAPPNESSSHAGYPSYAPPNESSSHGGYPGYGPLNESSSPYAPPNVTNSYLVGSPATGYPPYSSSTGHQGPPIPPTPLSQSPPVFFSSPMGNQQHGWVHSGTHIEGPHIAHPPAPPHYSSHIAPYLRAGHPR